MREVRNILSDPATGYSLTSMRRVLQNIESSFNLEIVHCLSLLSYGCNITENSPTHHPRLALVHFEVTVRHIYAVPNH